MRQLLIITGSFYPNFSPPGVVLYRLLNPLREIFDVTVVTQRRGKNNLGKDFSYEGVRVIEVTDWINDLVIRNANLVSKLFYFAVGFFRGNKLSTFNIRKTVKQIVELHKKIQFDAMLSIGFPAASHVAAMIVKKMHPEIRWVTYSTDSLYKHMYFRTHGRFFRGLAYSFYFMGAVRSELAAYKMADHVYLTPELEHWFDDLPELDKSKISRLNYTIKIRKNETIRNVSPNSVVNIMYAGTFYEDIRNPTWFCRVIDEVLKQNQKIVFKFYLTTNVCRDAIETIAKKHMGNVKIMNPISPNKISELYDQNDILLNFSNDADQFAPSKAYEYISTGMPILDVRYAGRKISALFLDYPAFLSLANNDEVQNAAKELLQFAERVAGVRIPFHTLQEIYKDYLVDTVAHWVSAELMKGCN